MAIRGIPQTIPELVSEASALHRQGRVAEAANLYMHILEREPNNLNALHLYGVLSLQAGQPQQAIRNIERAIEVDASRSLIHFNLGNAYLQAGRVDDAVGAYRRALVIDNGLADTWCALGNALVRAGDYEDAMAAAQQALQIEPDSVAAHNCIAMAHQSAGELERALREYQRALQLAPEDPELLNRAGFACFELGRYEDAAKACRQASLLAPEFGPAYFNLGLALTESGRLAAACKALARAIELIPGSATCHNALGRAQLLCGRHEEARREFGRAAELDPQLASAHNNCGLAAQRLGDISGALAAFDRALAVDSGYADAWLNLAVLYEQSNRLEEADETVVRGLSALGEDPSLNLVAARLQRRGGDPEAAAAVLEKLSAADLSPDLLPRVLFERGRVADIQGREEDAFRCFAEANGVRRDSPAGQYFRQQDYAGQVQLLAGAMAGDWADNWSHEELGSDATPAFLLGFPRSGTTLLEQVLAGHPGVVAMEEQGLIAALGQKLVHEQGDYPALLGSLPVVRRRELREEYLVQAQARSGWREGQLLLDKFPLNSVHLPLIHCLFPDARLILALRHPCDVVLSCFMQDFDLNEAMVNFTSLEGSARLYDSVMSICDSARRQLPLQLREVRYENLVDDLEGQARSALAFLGLEWSSDVLDFNATAAAKPRIETPSYEQVSQPLYREARLRWQRYRAQLAGIESLLQSQCERLGYTLDISD